MRLKQKSESNINKPEIKVINKKELVLKWAIWVRIKNRSWTTYIGKVRNPKLPRKAIVLSYTQRLLVDNFSFDKLMVALQKPTVIIIPNSPIANRKK